MYEHGQEAASAEGVLARLADIIEARRGADPGASYVATLLAAGDANALKKIGEEAVELVLALRSGGEEDIVHETADLLFHVLVALARRGVRPEAVLAELERRFGKSGHEEKAARGGA